MKTHNMNQTMIIFRYGLWTILFALTMTLVSAIDTSAKDSKQVVRIARIKIDPAQLEAYKTALFQEIQDDDQGYG